MAKNAGGEIRQYAIDGVKCVYCVKYSRAKNAFTHEDQISSMVK